MVREYVRFWKGLLFGFLIVLPFWVLMASFALADHTLISPSNNTNIATVQDKVDLVVQNGGTSSTIYFVNHSNGIAWCTNTSVVPNAVVWCRITIGERQEVKWSVNDTHGLVNFYSGVLNFTSTSDSHAPMIVIISDTTPLNLTESTFNFTFTCVDCGSGNTSWVNYTRAGVSRKPVAVFDFNINQTNNYKNLVNTTTNATCTIPGCPVWNSSSFGVDGSSFLNCNSTGFLTTYAINTSNRLTIMIWAKIGAQSIDRQNALGRYFQQYSLGISGSSNLSSYTINLNDTQFNMAKQVLYMGRWYHLAYTWNGSDWVGYVDGIEINRTIKEGYYLGREDRVWQICNDGNSHGTRGWNGSVDDVRIYNYALSGQEISEYYNATVAGRNPRILPEMTEIGDNWTTNVCSANATRYLCSSKTFFIKANLSILGYDYINESITSSSFIVELNLSDAAHATLYVSTSPTFEVYESYYSTYSDRHDILAHSLLNNTLYYFYINGSNGLFYTTDIKSVTTKQTEVDVSMIQLAIGVILIGLIFWLVYAAKGLNTKTEKDQPILVNMLLQYTLYSTAALIAFFLIQIAYIFSIDAVLSVAVQTTIKTIFVFVNTVGIIIFAILGLALIWSVFAWIIGMLKGSGVEARDRQR